MSVIGLQGIKPCASTYKHIGMHTLRHFYIHTQHMHIHSVCMHTHTTANIQQSLIADAAPVSFGLPPGKEIVQLSWPSCVQSQVNILQLFTPNDNYTVTHAHLVSQYFLTCVSQSGAVLCGGTLYSLIGKMAIVYTLQPIRT